MLRGVLLAMAVTTGAACADEDPMANLYGNTLTVISQQGHNQLFYNPDHTFTGRVVATGEEFGGTWTIEGTRLCTHLAGLPEPHCGTMEPGHVVGDSWEDHRANGTISRLTLTAGR